MPCVVLKYVGRCNLSRIHTIQNSKVTHINLPPPAISLVQKWHKRERWQRETCWGGSLCWFCCSCAPSEACLVSTQPLDTKPPKFPTVHLLLGYGLMPSGGAYENKNALFRGQWWRDPPPCYRASIFFLLFRLLSVRFLQGCCLTASARDLWPHLPCFSPCPAKFMTDESVTERQRGREGRERGRKLDGQTNKEIKYSFLK